MHCDKTESYVALSRSTVVLRCAEVIVLIDCIGGGLESRIQALNYRIWYVAEWNVQCISTSGDLNHAFLCHHNLFQLIEKYEMPADTSYSCYKVIEWLQELVQPNEAASQIEKEIFICYEWLKVQGQAKRKDRNYILLSGDVKTKHANSGGHRPMWWGECDIDMQWTQCFAGPYCVNQSLPHTYIYEERSLSLV